MSICDTLKWAVPLVILAELDFKFWRVFRFSKLGFLNSVPFVPRSSHMLWI